MINKILYEGKEILKRVKEGKNTWFYLEDKRKLLLKDIIGKKIQIQCKDCKKYSTIKLYLGKNGLLKRKYYCKSCLTKGENNPFYGKKHTKEFKEKLSKERKGKWYIGKNNFFYGKNPWLLLDEETREKKRIKLRAANSGKNNPFYGKKHPKKAMDIIVKKIKKWRDSLTKEGKQKESEKLSKAQKKIFKKDPDKYIANKRKAGYASIKSHKKYEINKIEIIVQNELRKRNLDFKYSVILGCELPHAKATGLPGSFQT